MAYCEFPKDFAWGVATSSFQVEGALNEDGRGPSIWDTYCNQPGKIDFDQIAEPACDSYHRYKDDVRLMKDLGIKAYRFSVAWSRIFPNGTGTPNAKGLDYYQRLVDELIAAGIQPWMTLYHWDLPQALEDRFGGWESKECSHAFGDYAGYMMKHLGDRLKGVFTMNEFFCFLDISHCQTEGPPHAPGKKLPLAKFNQVRHHALLGHGLAVQAMRAARTHCPPIGMADNPPICVPVIETEAHIQASQKAQRELSTYLTPIMEGAYHPAFLEKQGKDAPVFTSAEMKIISSPLDFVGVNIYNPTFIQAAPETAKGWEPVAADPGYPRMHMPWLTIYPAILYWGPRHISELWKPKAIYVTENGCPYPDMLNEKGESWDLGRMMYLQQHLIAGHRAISEGYPLKGYFLWSLMDNFEWLFGVTKRVGICYTDFRTQQRIPKLSAKFYAEVIRKNAIG